MRSFEGPLRLCLIASCNFPVAEPFAGGLEAQTHALTRELVRRGHEVTLYAAPGSDPELGAHELTVHSFESSEGARTDLAAPPEQWMREHHAYLALMLELARSGHRHFDLVHNNSLHHLPIAMASALRIPLVTTLHTPPVPWLESAALLARGSVEFLAVSETTARAWRPAVNATPVPNGVDLDQWRQGPGGSGTAIWSGRVVPEKAPHLAIDAARVAGLPIDLAGPLHDRGYFHREIVPRLADDVRYLGHLSQAGLTAAVGRASVAVVTPAWDEPYGLVAAEATSCGTPVAAFARGALPDLIGARSGCLAIPDDVASLARAIRGASLLPRDGVRRTAVETMGLGRMVDDYESVYRALIAHGAPA